MSKLDDLLKFVNFTHDFREIKRITNNRDHSSENDAEHSYQLAMTAWFLVTKHKIPLDLTLVLKYALIHDLVEVYSGDVWFYDEESRKDKKEREQKAFEKLKEEFPDFRDLHHLLKDYLRLISKEAQFVYALDKLLPIINNHLDGGTLWREHKLTLEKIETKKREKIKISPDVLQYFELVIEHIQKDEKKLFRS